MVTYSVHTGQTNFRPLENPLPRFNAKGFELEFLFHKGGWCSREEWGGDQDYYDWQKLKGLTGFFSLNNRNSAMFAFRYGEQEESYQIAPYTNFKGRWKVSQEIIILAGQPVTVQAVFGKDKVTYYYGPLRVEHDFKRRLVMREIGTYAGGANNAPGPHGGQAFKDMKIDIDFKVTKTR